MRNTYDKWGECFENHVGVLSLPLEQVVSDDGDNGGDEDVTEEHSKFSDTGKGTESEDVRSDDFESFHGSWAESN